MNTVQKTFLFISIVAIGSVKAMDTASLVTDHTDNKTNQSRIPSLERIVLDKLCESLVKGDDGTLLKRLKELYPEASSQCAKVLAENYLRVLYWKLSKGSRRSVQIDHRNSNAENLPLNDTWNKVKAAAISPDNRYLITITCRSYTYPLDDAGCQWQLVANVWRVSDIERDMSAHGPLELVSHTSLAKPLSEFCISPLISKYLDVEVAWHPSSTKVAIAADVGLGDCTILTVDGQGKLSGKCIFNVIPQEEFCDIPKDLKGKRDYFKFSGTYISFIEYSKDGTRLLVDKNKKNLMRDGMHIERSLFCINPDDESLFAPWPVRNTLDNCRCIAENVLVATWYPDGRILYLDQDDKVLHTINQEGTVLEKIPLSSPNDSDKLSLLFRKKMTILPKHRQVLITSFADSEDCRLIPIKSRFERASLDDGSTECLFNRTQGRAEIQMLDDRYGFQVFDGYYCGYFMIELWDFQLKKNTVVVKWDRKNNTNPFYSSCNGKYVVISLTGRLLGNDNSPLIISLKTPETSMFTLDQLVVLAKMDQQGVDMVLKNPAYAALYKEIGSMMNGCEEVLQEYFRINKIQESE